MTNLELAIKKFSLENSIEELIKGLQSKGELPLGQNEYPLFQEYMLNLIKIKSSNNLAEQLITFNDSLNQFATSSKKTTASLTNTLDNFSKTANSSSRVLNFLTGVLALATITQVIVTAYNIFNK